MKDCAVVKSVHFERTIGSEKAAKVTFEVLLYGNVRYYAENIMLSDIDNPEEAVYKMIGRHIVTPKRVKE